jgi:hypothetical protein
MFFNAVNIKQWILVILVGSKIFHSLLLYAPYIMCLHDGMESVLKLIKELMNSWEAIFAWPLPWLVRLAQDVESCAVGKLS